MFISETVMELSPFSLACKFTSSLIKIISNQVVQSILIEGSEIYACGWKREKLMEKTAGTVRAKQFKNDC